MGGDAGVSIPAQDGGFYCTSITGYLYWTILSSTPSHSALSPPSGPPSPPPGLARRLGLFDATMLVMGGIVGSGIFMNPYVVATKVHTPSLILGAWLIGGCVAIAGAFIYAELAARRPKVGGQYAYIREAYHPAVAFVYGWSLLLVTQTGGMAAVAVTFARYFLELTHLAAPDWLVASAALAALTVINCLGVRAGTNFQNLLMVLKIGAIGALVVAGFTIADGAKLSLLPFSDQPVSLNFFTAMGAALTPVLFAYGGWQTSCFIAGEMKQPEKNLPRGLLLGVLGVIVLYLTVNVVCLGVLGADGLAATRTPATEIMRRALGERGVVLIALGITISTLGFLSQSMLTAPRVYFAMADDKLFFKSVASIHPRTRVPVAAIALQGLFAIIIAVSGKYEQILNYVVSTDFVFFGLSATCLFVFRRRDALTPGIRPYRMPGHPWITIFFIAVSWLVVANTIFTYPGNSLIGTAIMVSGIPAYYYWKRKMQ
jgi:APA family basic amino acid/polyamine antiporter